MRVLVVEPERRPEVRVINGTVGSMQEIVGGELQAMYPADNVALVFNESAKVLKLPPNRGVKDEDGLFCDIVCGTFFLCGAPEDGNYFVSLTAEQLQRYAEIFAAPEVFLNLGGRTIILPLKIHQTQNEQGCQPDMRNISERHAVELNWPEVCNIVSEEIEEILGLRIQCKINVVENSLWDVTFVDYRLPLPKLCQLLQAAQATPEDWEDALPDGGGVDVNGIGTALAEKLISRYLRLTWEKHLITEDRLWLVGLTESTSTAGDLGI